MEPLKTTTTPQVEESCVHAELIRAYGIPFRNDLCCKASKTKRPYDYALLEHVRSGHFDSRCPSLLGQDEAPVELAPIRMELPLDEVHCLVRATLDEPLRSPRHIRLIALHARTATDTEGEDGRDLHGPHLHCEVFQASLDEISTSGQPMFMAVSYVCGDQTRLRRIGCGSGSVGVPQNAYEAMHHLRLNNRPRLIWLDYLCIKQNDDREKSHQVSMLHEIYAQAHVVSWLGTGYGMDLECMSYYMPLLAHIWTTTSRANPTLEFRETVDLFKANLAEYLLSQATVKHPRYSGRRLAMFFTTGYFERVWTAQELILGKTSTCQIGDAIFSTAVIATAARMLLYLRNDTLTVLDQDTDGFDSQPLETVLSVYLQPAVHKHWIIDFVSKLRDLNIVEFFRRRSCSNPRDRIYGLRSLFANPGTYIVDYSLSIAETFADFTVHCMLNGNGIAVVNHNQREIDSSDEDDLPSWCPDWADGGPKMGLEFTDEKSKYCGWHASGVQNFIHSRPSKLALSLKGLVVGRLSACRSSPLNWIDFEDDECTELMWLDDSENFFHSQGITAAQDILGSVLRILDHVLVPKAMRTLGYRRPRCGNLPEDPFGSPMYSGPAHRDVEDGTLMYRDDEFSEEMCRLFRQTNPSDHLRDLMAAVYIAKVDPWLYEATGLEIDPRIPADDYARIERVLCQMLVHYSRHTRLFATEHGMIGTGPNDLCEGDMVCILYGSDVPQILQHVGDGRYILVGACVVDGLMFGEGLEMGLPEQDLILV